MKEKRKEEEEEEGFIPRHMMGHTHTPDQRDHNYSCTTVQQQQQM